MYNIKMRITRSIKIKIQKGGIKVANKIKVNYQHDEEEDNEQFLRNFEYKGEEIFACDTCETEISEEEYNRNDGICDECNAYI